MGGRHNGHVPLLAGPERTATLSSDPGVGCRGGCGMDGPGREGAATTLPRATFAAGRDAGPRQRGSLPRIRGRSPKAAPSSPVRAAASPGAVEGQRTSRAGHASRERRGGQGKGRGAFAGTSSGAGDTVCKKRRQTIAACGVAYRVDIADDDEYADHGEGNAAGRGRRVDPTDRDAYAARAWRPCDRVRGRGGGVASPVG